MMNKYSAAFAMRALACAALAVASIARAYAADPAPVKPLNFNELDTNHDGYIDNKEADSSLEVSGWLMTHDTNKDGKLSADEFSAAKESLGIRAK